jgi:putative hydrolase of the HAD superfamily
MIKAIFVDMDDTLIVNQILFDRAEAQLYSYLQNLGVPVEEAKAVFDQTDKELFKIYGRSPKRSPEAFEAVLRHFVPDADAEMVSIVRGQASSIFTARAEVKPGVAEAVELLAKHYPIYIITAGGQDVQKSRMKNIPFMNKIQDVMIVDQKDVGTYKAALKKWQLKPNEVVMIGDSLGSDVIPAVGAGLQAVWIDAHNSARHETKEGFPAKNAYKFSSLLEMAHALVLNKGQLVAPALPAMTKAVPPVPKFG